jgi:hypothetical protein
MYRLIALLITLVALFSAGFGQGFYDVSVVHTIELHFTQSNWDQILDSLWTSGNDERLVASVTIDGIDYDSVGVRYKGPSTYDPDRIKNPFNIKLDYVFPDQKIDGYGTLKLANVWFDPSFIREVLGYDIARKYMPASLANFANVYANGTLLGLYTNDQDIDKLFMQTHFLSKNNARLKGEVIGSPVGRVVWGYEGEDSTNYTSLYELESDAGWSELIDFLDTLNNYPQAVEKVLNVDRHLWMLAFDNLLVNLDSPINFPHNYYLYRDDSYRFNPIIWDLNMNLGGYNHLIPATFLTIPQLQQLDPFLNQANPNYPILNKILSNATYKRKYIAHLKTIMQENFSNNWYLTRAQQLRTIIDPHVQADPNKYSSYANYLASLNTAVGATPGIAQLMSARLSYLNSLPQINSQAPTITTITHTPAVIPANSTCWVSANVTDATTVQLAYRSNPTGPYTTVSMFDDGAHHDGTAADGVFGASIPAGNADIHYYLYAENINAGAFAPPRAEYEDSVLIVVVPVPPPIVINEFLADNATTQADQNGEFDDWIELHNLSDQPISLKGFHLSDKPGTIGKWTFPDTSIAANGYLIIWADENGTQVGLHANFKLSASGEAVVFSDTSLTIIDSLSFGPQTKDVSLGRCPNGTGTFMTMSPSFAARNHCPALCGDADGTGDIDIADAVFLVSYIFAGGSAPNPISAGDADCDGEITIADAAYLVSYIFSGGPEPCSQC